MRLKVSLAMLVVSLISGCTTIAGSTNILTDDRIKSETSGVLGFAPSEITIVSRRTEGTNTYVALQAKGNKEFNCIINGGNLLSMGLVNPPMCAKKGEAIKANPFQR